MLRLIINIFLMIAGFFINSTLFEMIKLRGVKPDLFIIIIVSISVLRNDIEGALFGFFAGLIRDVFFGGPIGFFAFLYMLAGYICGKPFKYFYRENYFIPMILCFIITIFFEAFVFILKFFRTENILYAVNRIIFPQAIYNTVLILILYIPLYLINKRLEEKEISHHKFF